MRVLAAMELPPSDTQSVTEGSGMDEPAVGANVFLVPNPKGLAARLLAYVEEEDAHPLPGDGDRDDPARSSSTSAGYGVARAHGAPGGAQGGPGSGMYTDRSEGFTTSAYTEAGSRLMAVDLSAWFGRSTLEVGDGTTRGYRRSLQDSKSTAPRLSLPEPGAVTDLHVSGSPRAGAPDVESAAQAATRADAQTTMRTAAGRPPRRDAKGFDILSLGGRWEDAFRPSVGVAKPSQPSQESNAASDTFPSQCPPLPGVPEYAAAADLIAKACEREAGGGATSTGSSNGSPPGERSLRLAGSSRIVTARGHAPASDGHAMHASDATVAGSGFLSMRSAPTSSARAEGFRPTEGFSAVVVSQNLEEQPGSATYAAPPSLIPPSPRGSPASTPPPLLASRIPPPGAPASPPGGGSQNSVVEVSVSTTRSWWCVPRRNRVGPSAATATAAAAMTPSAVRSSKYDVNTELADRP